MQPMGVPNEYVVEFFCPSLDEYELFHNVGVLPIDMADEDADKLSMDGEGQVNDPERTLSA